MRLLFCGVRGSTPAPGAEFIRIGGHTSCVALSHDDADAPVLVLDAGTGLRRLSDELGGAPFRGTILLTHLHWDHVQGLPFFAAGDRDDARVRLVMPDQGNLAAQVLARSMGPPHFPIDPGGLRGSWTIDGIGTGRHQVEGFSVTALDVPHKGGRTFGYRIEDGHSSMAYLPDHLPEPSDPAVRGLVAGVDVLVHDAQFLAPEEEAAVAYGHATVDQAVALAGSAGVGRLVLFHHAPGRGDDQVEAIAAGLAGGPVPVVAAHEGLRISLCPTSARSGARTT